MGTTWSKYEAALVRRTSVPPEYATVVLAALTLLALLVALVLRRIARGGGSGGRSGRSGRRRGDAVVLLGPSAAGKTALFYRLFKNTFPESVTSMEVHEREVVVGERTVPVVDVPGHARLRPFVPTVLPRAAAVVFVVDATATSARELREVADFLYDVFVECIRLKCEPKVLVACNKSDAKGASTPEALKKLLEAEMDLLKTTRHAVETEGDEEADIILGTDGVPFEFDSDAGCQVDWSAVSAKDGEITSIEDFIAEAL